MLALVFPFIVFCSAMLLQGGIGSDRRPDSGELSNSGVRRARALPLREAADRVCVGGWFAGNVCEWRSEEAAILVLSKFGVVFLFQFCCRSEWSNVATNSSRRSSDRSSMS